MKEILCNVNVYVDLDGVLVDFEQGFKNIFGKPHNSIEENIMWELIASHDNYWSGLPIMKGALYFWTYISQFNPTILTGCPRRHGYTRASEGKKIWCQNELGSHINVITCASRDKPLHMKNKNDVLFDDLPKNINNWEKNGGIGILYSDPISAIERFKSKMYDLKR